MHERWTRRQLLAYQTERVSHLRAYALAHSPFYRPFHAGYTHQPLAALPVLTKALLREHFDELVTDRTLRLADLRAHAAHDQPRERYRGRYWVNATSGSSGQPGFFVFDEAEWLTIMASFARSQAWSGVGLGLFPRMRMATVASVNPWHLSSQVAMTASAPYRSLWRSSTCGARRCSLPTPPWPTFWLRNSSPAACESSQARFSPVPKC